MTQGSTSDSLSKVTFLNGWIGERLTELWLRSRGYQIRRAVQQHRGTKKATSSGDIDLVAKKGSKVLYIEVKSWEKNRLNPSWLVQFMLDRNKLNTLFEKHADATDYILVYRYPATGIFKYSSKAKYIKTLVSRYNVPRPLILAISGQPASRFAYVVLDYLVHKNVGEKVRFKIIYFKEILDNLTTTNNISKCQSALKEELLTLFDDTFSQIVAI